MSGATKAISAASTTPACSMGRLSNGSPRYRVRARFGDRVVEMEDPYRFPPVLSDFDLYLLAEGTHMHLYEKLGAHPMVIDGVAGVAFAVFAPDARRVSVVGDFNFWDGRRHAMRVRGNGFWEIFIPGVKAGDKYKYEIIGSDGQLCAVEVRSDGFRSRGAAAHRFDRRRPRYRRPAGAARRRRQCVERADLDLRGASRLLAPPSRRRAAVGSAIASWQRSCRPTRTISASRMSNSCR